MSPLSNKTVLIVDNDKDICDILGDYLRPHAHRTLIAEDGLAALELFRNNNIDLSIIDINMPKMNGFELLGKIRWNYPNVINIITSGDILGLKKQSAFLYQNYHFLVKPFTRTEVLEIVYRVLGGNYTETDDYKLNVQKNKTQVPGTKIPVKKRKSQNQYDPEMKLWLSYFNQLAHFRKKNPSRWPRHREVWMRKNIGYWLRQQQKEYHKLREGKISKLTFEQINLLNTITFPWTSNRESWMDKYKQLKAYKENHPDSWPSCSGEEKKLGIWCSFLRGQLKKHDTGIPNLLDNQKIKLLKEINFI